MKFVVVSAALIVALLFQTTVAGMSLQGGTLVNFVLVAVICIALALGALTGLLAGAAGGLVQDAVAGGVVGIGGLSKTLVGFLVGVFGALWGRAAAAHQRDRSCVQQIQPALYI